jgi:hypothetical protein
MSTTTTTNTSKTTAPEHRLSSDRKLRDLAILLIGDVLGDVLNAGDAGNERVAAAHRHMRQSLGLALEALRDNVSNVNTDDAVAQLRHTHLELLNAREAVQRCWRIADAVRATPNGSNEAAIIFRASLGEQISEAQRVEGELTAELMSQYAVVL